MDLITLHINGLLQDCGEAIADVTGIASLTLKY